MAVYAFVEAINVRGNAAMVRQGDGKTLAKFPFPPGFPTLRATLGETRIAL